MKIIGDVRSTSRPHVASLGQGVLRTLLHTIRTRRAVLASMALLASIVLSLSIAVRGRGDPILSVPFSIDMTAPTGIAIDPTTHHAVIVGVTTNRGSVTIFDTAARRVIRKAPLPNCPASGLIIDARLHRAYVPAYDCQSYDPTKASRRAYLDVLDSDTGRIVRALSLPSDITDLALDTRSSRLFIETDHGGVVALTPMADRVAWRAPLRAMQFLVDESEQRLFVMTARSVVALDEVMGTRLDALVVPLHKLYASVGLIDDHNALIYSVQGIDHGGFAIGPTILYSVDPRNLHVLRHSYMQVHGIPVSIDDYTQRAVAETTLYSSPVTVGSSGDSVSVIDLRSGQLLCHTADYFTMRGGYIAAAQHLVINVNDLDVALLPEDCRGKQRTIKANMDVSHVAFDSGAERLYLIGQVSGTSSQPASRWPTMISRLLPWLFAPPRQSSMDQGILRIVDLR